MLNDTDEACLGRETESNKPEKSNEAKRVYNYHVVRKDKNQDALWESD